MEIIPWGWNQDVVRWAETHQLPITPPQVSVVATANSRGFSTEFETRLGVGLAGQATCASFSEVRQAIHHFDRWLIKGQFAASGRERIAGRDWRLSNEQAAWIERRLAADGQVFAEPLVKIVSEAGMQWDVPRDHDRPPTLVGVTGLISDERGQYVASVFESGDRIANEWRDAVETTRIVAADLQQRGYHGPLGIDSARYIDVGGAVRLRPLQDINARWTMGRLSLGWRDRLPAGGAGRLGGKGEPFGDGSSEVHAVSPERLGGLLVAHRFWLEIHGGEGLPPAKQDGSTPAY
jgi:hypothetical protein